jgi:hypothetical protein
MSRSIQATAFNEQADEQRNAFSGSETGTFGASRTDMSTIFTNASAPTAGEIMERAVRAFQNTGAQGEGSPTTEVPSGQNFDFFNGLSGDFIRFRSGENKFDVVKGNTLADLPNQFGPNLAVPDINSDPLDDNQTPTEGSLSVAPSTFDSYGVKGFGTFIDRNNPDESSISSANTLKTSGGAGTFLTRRGVNANGTTYTPRSSGRQILGEYIDSNTYVYNQPEDVYNQSADNENP